MEDIKTVVVLGGRSGTSLVAGMIHLLGVYMGETMRAPDAKNPTGYYENMDFVRLTGMLLENSGESVFLTSGVKNTTLGDLMNIRDTVWKHEQSPVWGFKAPGTTFVVPLYELFLRNPHYIVCKRDVEEVGESLKKMGHDLPEGRDDWTQAATEIQSAMMKNTEGKERLVIEFDELMNNPEKIVDNIINFLDLEVGSKHRKAAIGLANPSFRHEKNGAKFKTSKHN